MFAGLIAIGLQRESISSDQPSDMEYQGASQGHHAPSHIASVVEPGSEHNFEKENPVAERESSLPRSFGWRPRLPNFRHGGKSSLGLKTAF